jgi:hypothetical protein
MTRAQSILDYLWSIAPEGATNRQIADGLGIRSHQAVYMLTQDLARRGLITADRPGSAWIFGAVEEPAVLAHSAGTSAALLPVGRLTPRDFERLAARVLVEHYGTILAPGTVPGVHKRFDLVSADSRIVGDAKYYTRVGGIGLPPAKFSIIAEHVWLLEKTGAPITFLVFGNDRLVPVLWLERYGNLVSGTVFYFLTDDGQLEQLPRRTDAIGERPPLKS